MKDLGVDVLISAPQKGWSASPCSALVMLGERALNVLETTASTSFACDLRKWRDIMIAYENGGHAYHATMPTDALTAFRDTMLETVERGLDTVKAQQWQLGKAVRALMAEHGFASVAAPGFEAPGVVVSYTGDDGIKSGAAFVAQGLQTAGGVPLMCDEPADFKTFRVGLFGLDNRLGSCDFVDHLGDIERDQRRANRKWPVRRRTLCLPLPVIVIIERVHPGIRITTFEAWPQTADDCIVHRVCVLDKSVDTFSLARRVRLIFVDRLINVRSVRNRV